MENSEIAPYIPTLYILQLVQFIKLLHLAAPEKESNSCSTLLFFTGGSGKIQIEEESYELGQGKCFLLKPNRTLSIKPNSNGCSYYKLIFSANLQQTDDEQQPTDPNSRSSLMPRKAELACTPFTKALELLEDLDKQQHDNEELLQFHRYVRFHELLLFLFRQNKNGSADAQTDSERQRVELSIQQIHHHYQDMLTVEDLAAIANIDRWKYTRLFKEATGQVPLQYLNDVRIKEAKKWLLGADDRLSDIAQHAGFNNEYYFNRRFKQTVGISPGQYRRSHREQLRVVAPYLEDFLVALNIMPIVQYSHARWGKQTYLGLNQIPTFDALSGDFAELSSYKPDLILLMDRYEQNQYSQCQRISSTCILREYSHNWRAVLHTVADYFGRSDLATEAISSYEAKARTARQQLNPRVKKETVAFLRISADFIHQYTVAGRGFATAVLYDDLGLLPHPTAKGANPSMMSRIRLEDLSSLTADHLFITFDKWHTQAEGAERKLLHHPAWSSLPAVRNNHVYEVDFLTWMNNGVISNNKKIDDIMQALA